MTAPRAALLLGLAGALAIGVGLRLSTYRELQSGPRVRPLTDDDNYHLRRARFAVAHYPRTIVFDPLMNFPEGGVPIWPPLFDLALATPARLLHGPGAAPAEIERGAAWVPIFFAAGAILIAGLLGREIFGDLGGVVTALFLAVCPGHILWTQYGHTDQHVAESFFGLLVLWLFVRSRGKRGGPGVETATGIALGLATLAWQGAIYWGAVFALALVLEALVTRRSVWRAALLSLALPAGLVAAATRLWLGELRPPLTYISFGFFQPLFLAALTAGTIGIDTFLAAKRGELRRRDTALRLAAAVLLLAGILPFARDLALGLARAFGYVVGETSGEIATATGYVSYPKNWLKGIFEARPLLADGPGLAVKRLSLSFFLSPLAILLWALRARRGERPGLHLALAVWSAVTLLLSLSQRMDVYYAAPLAAVTLVEAARLFAERIATDTRRRRLAAAGLGLVLLSPFAWSTPEEVRTIRAP
ncbi:MAG: STT3 domain-containing protein, partial [Thermoanaerobaculia bacterium]